MFKDFPWNVMNNQEETYYFNTAWLNFWNLFVLFPPSQQRKRGVALKQGDYVRISCKKRMFQKEDAATWTDEIFKSTDVINKSTPPTCIVEDLLGEEITGRFYREQLQRVQLPTFVVDKIHRRRVRKGITEALVSWRG